MSRPIGYYVHHHGAGHRIRYESIAAASARHVVAIGELPWCDLVLPSDVPPGEPDDPTAGGSLHWAPLDPATSAPRLRRLVEWIDRVRPAGVVVDVSVETALACRLAGVPTIVVRQPGDRTDPPHRLAYSTAERLLAPFPAALEHPSTPTWVGDATDHVGHIVRRARADVVDDDGAPRPGPDDAVVLWGRGGGDLGGALVDSLAASVPGCVYVVGTGAWSTDDRPTRSDVVDLGWVADPDRLLARRPVVLAAAGLNSVADAIAHECALIVAPQERPFDEQHRYAMMLDRTGVAVVVEPVRAVTPPMVARARTLAETREPDDGLGSRRAAAVIDRWFP